MLKLLLNLIKQDFSLLKELQLFTRLGIVELLLRENNILIIKGKYKNLLGSKVRETKKNYYIKLLLGKEVRIKKINVIIYH
tara:strand:+ start:539 stop:781 length:243 start_codon:yes stop_codon:yes gene_type:complete